MRIILPWPPTANNAFPTVNGRRRLSRAGQDYCDVVAKLALIGHWSNMFGLNDAIAIRIMAHPPDRRPEREE